MASAKVEAAGTPELEGPTPKRSNVIGKWTNLRQLGCRDHAGTGVVPGRVLSLQIDCDRVTSGSLPTIPRVSSATHGGWLEMFGDPQSVGRLLVSLVRVVHDGTIMIAHRPSLAQT